MAHMSQDHKKELAPGIKAILKKYGIKGSIGVDNHSSLVVTLKEGKLDIVENHNKIIEEHNKERAQFGGPQGRLTTDNYIQVNEYYIESSYSGDVLNFLKELKTAMDVGNFDKSDLQTDYHHVGWYVKIQVGRWNKGYQVI